MTSTIPLDIHTLQPVNSPLLELLKRYLCRWRGLIEAQSVRIVLLFEGWSCELLLFVIQSSSSLGIYLVEILSNHFVGSAIVLSICRG